MGKYLDRYALSANEPSDLDREAYWFHWMLRKNVAMDTWEEDQLSVSGVMFDLKHPQCAFREFDYQIGLSMHLLERVFQRMGTTSNEAVLDELIDPMLTACAMWPCLYWELRNSGVTSMPLMIPSKNGAILGDVVLSDDGGDIQFRTFIGGKADLTEAKQRLLQGLVKWRSAISQHDFAMGLQVSTFDYKAIPLNMAMPEVVNIRKAVIAYLGVLSEHHHALDTKDVRTERSRQEYRKWIRDATMGSHEI